MFSKNIKGVGKVKEDIKVTAWEIKEFLEIEKPAKGKRGVGKGTVMSMFLDLLSLTLKYIVCS